MGCSEVLELINQYPALTKADVEKLMAQNVQLMGEMMEQSKAQREMREEISQFRLDGSGA